MSTLDSVLGFFSVGDISASNMPIEIPGVGRDKLAELFAHLGYTRGAEVGVERGHYLETLCKSNPDAQMYGVDAWLAYPGYRDHVSQEKMDRFYEEAKQRLAPYRCELTRTTSWDAVRRWKSNHLDFVYIDANHDLPNVINDIHEWSQKVKTGGIIAGHDFRMVKPITLKHHVVQAVRAYTDAYQIKPWFVLGRKARRDGEVRDQSRSWFWVRE